MIKNPGMVDRSQESESRIRQEGELSGHATTSPLLPAPGGGLLTSGFPSERERSCSIIEIVHRSLGNVIVKILQFVVFREISYQIIPVMFHLHKFSMLCTFSRLIRS